MKQFLAGLLLGGGLVWLIFWLGDRLTIPEPPTQDWIWADSLEATIAAAENYQVLFENEEVRVLTVTLAPGDTEPLHTHPWPSLLYLHQGGRRVFKGFDEDGEKGLTPTLRDTFPPVEKPFAVWLPPEWPHTLQNLGPDTCYSVRVEWKKISQPANTY